MNSERKEREKEKIKSKEIMKGRSFFKIFLIFIYIYISLTFFAKRTK